MGNQIHKNIYCGFITQRPSTLKWGFDEEHEDFLRIRTILKHRIRMLIESGVKNFITSLTQGIEMTASEIVLELQAELYSDIRLVCVIPFEEQAAKWSPAQRERYFSIIERSSKAILLKEEYDHDCYADCFRWIASYSQCMIAVYDGMPRSSAGLMVNEAIRSRKYVVSINTKTFEVKSLYPDRNRIVACIN